jgi:Lecithin retinol acyltransferase
MLVAMDKPRQDDLPLGAHLVTPRWFYRHHGIYAGNGRVIHYAGFKTLFHRGPVEETTLEAFAGGRGIRVKPWAAPRFSGSESVARARSRIGEDRYRLLSNNCLHFARWCISGTPSFS